MSDDPVRAFWAWWTTRREAFASAFDAGGLAPALVEEMSAHVGAMSPGLDWEFGPGDTRPHHLAVTAAGDGALRPVAERWRRAAPDDDLFEFHAARRALPSTGWTLSFDGRELSFDDVVCSLSPDAQRERVDIALHHPAFAAADRDAALRMAFVLLDNTLGEDDVERWLGSVDANDDRAAASIPLSTLRARIDAFASACTGQAWALLRGERQGKPSFAVMNLALKRIDHVLLDLHVEVKLPILAPTEEGLPTRAEADALDAFEDGLVAALGEHAVHLGRETWNGARTVHLHVMESGPAADLVARYAARAGRPVDVRATRDPSWSTLRRFS